MKTSSALQAGHSYSRALLKELFGITDATINNGIFKPNGHDSVWLFVTEHKTPDRTQYEDRLQGDLLYMQGQTSGRTDALLIDHEERGLELLLFYRTKKYERDDAGFRYAGIFRYRGHTGSQPASFELQRLTNLPETKAFKYGDHRTWELALRAIEELGGRATTAEVIEHITASVPEYKATNARDDLNMLAVNSASRGNYGYNRSPRRTDQGHECDRLYKRGERVDVYYESYQPTRHGIWELYREDTSSICRVRQVVSGAMAELESIRAEESQQQLDPQSFEDSRVRTLAAIVRRQGQAAFRESLLTAYEGRCAMSGCDCALVLEAAHIYPYRGEQTNSVGNGLLLRSDLHTLFDLKLLWIDGKKLTICVSPTLSGTEYAALHGKELRLPGAAGSHPHPAALGWHAEQCALVHDSDGNN